MSSPTAHRAIEFHVHPGLGPIAAGEIAELFPGSRVVPTSASTIRVESGAIDVALRARTVVSAFVERTFAFPRPSGLSGHEALRQVAHDLGLAAQRTVEVRSFRVTAAGTDSASFRHWIEALEAETGMAHDAVDGGVVVRVVRAPPVGWRVLVRLADRPLSARQWRVSGFSGALDASVAAAMVRVSGAKAGDLLVDPTCGSGTILVEGLSAVAGVTAIGCDIAGGSLAAAAVNAMAAGVAPGLVQGDAQRLPFADRTADVICTNPPWGHQFGSAKGNDRLYPVLLAEAARIGTAASCLVVLTHDIRRFDALLRGQRDWEVSGRYQIELRGHHPVLWVLQRPTT